MLYICRLMEDLLKQIQDYKNEVETYTATDEKAVEGFRIKWLGTKGLVKSLMGEMKNVSGEKKKEFGQLLNDFKKFVEEKYDHLKSSINMDWYQLQSQPYRKKYQLSGGEYRFEVPLDLTLPGDNVPVGSRHPISMMTNRIISIFQRLGFAVAEGPVSYTHLTLPTIYSV